MKNDIQELIESLEEIEYLIKVGKYQKAKELTQKLKEELSQ